MYQSASPRLLNRPDTMLGVCEAIGQDFGFHPNFLRIGFGLVLLVNPVAVIGTYLALGVVVAASRVKLPRKAQAEAAPLMAVEPSHREAALEDQVALAA